jgi:hypothetical protein
MAPPLPGTPVYTLGDPRNDITATFDVAVKQSYYNQNWLVENKFLYSFTEDSDGDGRIDRIRAQAAFELTNTFNGFSVVVDGYEVNGYARVDQDPANISLPSPIKDLMTDMIYIYLKEKDDSDTGARPTWRVERNTSLKDFATQSIEIGLPEHGPMELDYICDTAPPRINYALTLPAVTAGAPGDIYVQFSEPVSDIEVSSIGSPAAPSSYPAGTPFASPSGRDILIPLTSSYEATNLAAASPPEFTVTGVRDRAAFAKDRRSLVTEFYAYLYPAPKYPRDWTYKEYLEVTGDGTISYPFTVRAPGFDLTLPFIKDWSDPGNYLDNRTGFGPVTPPTPPTAPTTAYGTDTHRVTDVLISVPPMSAADTQYFIWPIWAKYTTPPNSDPMNTGPTSTDTGIIWDFTGKKALEERNATLQVWENPLLASYTDPYIIYGFNVPREFRNPPEHDTRVPGHSGLWLPFPGSSPKFYNLVPRYVSPIISIDLDPVGTGSSLEELFNYDFTAGVNGYKSVSRLDFFFLLDISDPDLADLFVARLDIAPGTAIPPDWYRRIRPFSYDIHDITRQRNDVTILNNVINPTTGEKVYLNYRLSSRGRVTIQVFTLDGNLVKVLRRGTREAGEWTEAWDGRNNGGRIVARGMYFIRIVGPDIDEIRKVMVVK